MQETFYATFAQLSFALLGLWWVVVQFKHHDWMVDPVRRRTAFYVSMYFTLPGIMSLLSLLSEDATFIWRGAFALAGGCGVVVSMQFARYGSRVERRSAWLGVALFAVVTVVALVPTLVAKLGLSLTPIQVEGITLSAVLLVGVVTAWRMFAEPGDEGG